jgi:tetratricopeptide (TPR) repeat protein
LPKATAAARKAIEIDPTLAEPHVTLAFIHMWFDWDWAGAEAEAQRALTLNPNLAFAHIAHAQLLTALGRHPEAIAEATRARQLDPVSPIINTLEGMTFFYAKRYDEAAASLQKALDLNPRFWVAWFFRGNVQLARSDYAGASAAFDKAREFSGNGSQPVAMLALTAAQAGDASKARAFLAELQATSAKRYLPPYSVAVIYLGLDERENCFAWLKKACDERDVRLFFLGVDQIWDPLRSDPRFVSILQRIALP